MQEDEAMNRILSAALGLPLVAAGIALAGCQSQAQKEVDQQAKAIDKSYEAEADLKEAVAAGAPKAVRVAVHDKAEDLRNEGEATKDHLQAEAKELGKVPNK
jgi:predicted component of type VI protein secretion system